VEVDSQGWNSDQRLVNLDKFLDEFIAVLNQNTTCNAQVAIEPRGPDTTTICLNTNLKEANIGLLGNRLKSKAGRIGMSADNGDRVTRTPLAADGESYDGRGIASKVVFAARAEGRSPRVTLTDELETGFFETSRGRLDGVVSWNMLE
jgi:hypothetical protein